MNTTEVESKVGIFWQQEVDALKAYYKYCQEAEQTCTFEEWLEEFGYRGKLFATVPFVQLIGICNIL